MWFYRPAVSKHAFRLYVLLIVILLAVASASAVLRDGWVDPTYNVIPVSFALGSSISQFAVLPDGKILVVGGFSFVSGGTSNGIARLNPDGSFDPTFVSRTTGGVESVHPLADGRIVISGNFQQYDGVARNRIARINADGSLDQTFAPNLGSEYVEVTAVQPDGKIIVNGNFTAIGGVPRQRIARLHSNGTLDLTFDVGTGMDVTVIHRAAVLGDGKIVFVGKFSTYQGVTRRGVLRINADGSLDTAFASNVTGDFHEYFDLSLTADGKLYIVGDTLNGNQLFRLTDTGLIDITFNTGFMNTNTTGRIHAVVAQPDGRVMIGGDFGSIRTNGTNYTAGGLFRFNTDGSVDAGFMATTGGGVRALVMYSNDRVLVGGSQQSLNGSLRGGIGRLNIDSTLDTTFIGFLGAPTIAHGFHFLPDGNMYVYGGFEVIGTSFSRYVARLNADGVVDPTFRTDNRVNNQVWCLDNQPDGKIVLGGYAGSGLPSTGLWRINPDGSLDEGFGARIPQFEYVRDVKILPDGKILIAGNFAQVNGTNRRALARLNQNGSLDATFAPVIGGLSLAAIEVQPDGKILVGGDFSNINGTAISHIARLNPDGTLDSGFNIGSGANNTVAALQVMPSGKIYVGGNFSFMAGTERYRIARLNPDGQVDLTFKGPVLSSAVNSVVPLPQGKILIGGNMSPISNAAPRQRVLRLLDDGAIDYSFDVSNVTRMSSFGEVYQVGRHANGSFFVAGNFDAVSGIRRSGIAKLISVPRPTPAFFDFDGDGRTDVSVFRPSTGVWHSLYSYSGGYNAVRWGLGSDKITPVDFNGDFRTDIAVFRPDTGTWYGLSSAGNTVSVIPFGTQGDIPAPGDFDGDEKADVAVYRPADATWWLNRTRDGVTSIQFGAAEDQPVPADYDGDGKTDVAIFRPSNGQWWILRSSAGMIAMTFGNSTDKPVPRDYTGDGKADVAFWRPSTGEWFVLRSEDFSYYSIPFGTAGDIPAPGDYDGDGMHDATVFRPSSATWYSRRSTAGTLIQQFGATGDAPIANAFVP